MPKGWNWNCEQGTLPASQCFLGTGGALGKFYGKRNNRYCTE